MRIAFILHGKLSGNGKMHSLLNGVFSGLDYQIFYTQFTGHTETISAECTKAGFSHVVVCAGDGSLNEAVNGLMSLRDKDDSALPLLGILPFGTGNDFIKTVQSPRTFSGIRESIEANRFRLVDIGSATLNDISGHTIQRLLHQYCRGWFGRHNSRKNERFLQTFGRYSYISIPHFVYTFNI
jgi:diacylglycerol kinase (ATP)